MSAALVLLGEAGGWGTSVGVGAVVASMVVSSIRALLAACDLVGGRFVVRAFGFLFCRAARP